MTGTELVLIDADTTVRWLRPRAAVERGLPPAGAGAMLTGRALAHSSTSGTLRQPAPRRPTSHRNGAHSAQNSFAVVAVGRLALGLSGLRRRRQRRRRRRRGKPAPSASPCRPRRRSAGSRTATTSRSSSRQPATRSTSSTPRTTSRPRSPRSRTWSPRATRSSSSPRSTAPRSSDVLQKAEDSDIPVIAYDRLIRDSDAVDYYTTFDNLKVGELQARVPRSTGLEAQRRPRRPFNVELFAGSPDDNNATFFFNGAMEVLQPMIDSGDIKVVSGQTDFKQAAILRWDAAIGAEAHGEHPDQDLLQGRPSTACCRRTTACRAASSRRSRRNGYSGGGKRCPSSPARTPRSSRSSRSSRASSTRRSSRTRVSWPRSRSR